MTTPAPATQDTAAVQTPRRGRRARTDVAIVMAVVSIVSVLIVGIFNLVTARDFLTTTVERQLVSVGEARMDRLERGIESIGGIVVSVAYGTGTAQALEDLNAGYWEIDEPLSDAQVEELRALYAAELAEIVPPEYEAPPIDEVFPESIGAQYLQYHYLVENPFPFGERSRLDDAGDGSSYSEAHAVHHPIMRSMASALRLGDVLLIDAETSSVVYSVDKHSDLGTNLVSGPYRDSALAEAVIERLQTAAADEAVLVDFEAYGPAGFVPTSFMAAAIRDEGRVTGAVAVEIPNELLVNVITANQDWAGTGLGETGEVYIVGEDGLMRTDSRLWLEDPESYLEMVGEAGYDVEIQRAVEGFGTTVLIQPVSTEAAAAALTGDTFVGTTTNYLDQGTLTVAGPLDIKGLKWVAISEVTTSEAHAPLRRHIITLLILLVILVPVVIAAAIVLARRILRPIGPIVTAADDVRQGDLDVLVDVHTRDEFGDLSTKFNGVVATLRKQAADLEHAEVQTTELLQAVMPPRLVDQYQSGDQDIAEALSNATLVVVSVEEPEVAQAAEREAIADHTVAVSTGIATLAKRHGLEQVVSSATRYIAVAGLNAEDDEAGKAVAFAFAVRDWLNEAGSNAGIVIAASIGLASGDVVTGVVGTERVAFNVWGNPRRRAETLATVAGRDEILVDPAVASHVGDEWAVDPVIGLVGLDGAQIDGWRVVGRRRDVSALENLADTD
jgi:methyl-accepting chemotaxis protein